MSTNYATEAARFLSFHSWRPLDSLTTTPQTLAAAGFYYNPADDSPDRCTCFMCGVSLISWVATDIPLDEHKCHNKYNCEFLKKLVNNHLTTDDQKSTQSSSPFNSLTRSIIDNMDKSWQTKNISSTIAAIAGASPEQSSSQSSIESDKATRATAATTLTLLRCAVIRELLFGELLELQADENDWKCTDIPLL
jgi:hypothetical protein